jgi:hypothetical protein
MNDSKKARLLGDPNAMRWFKNLERSSKSTADVAVRRLSLYCKLNQTTPKKLLKLAANKFLSKVNFDLLCDTVSRLEKGGKKDSYIDGIRKAVLLAQVQ